jgi:hypothetical protein
VNFIDKAQNTPVSDPDPLAQARPVSPGPNESRKRYVRVSDVSSNTGKSPASRRRNVADRLSQVPRLLLTREESARALGMSLRHFQRHVQPQLPCVYCGQLRLYRPGDLKRWIDSEAAPAGRIA